MQKAPTTMEGLPDVRAILAARASGVKDDFKLGLALEGGGMRGIVSGAMLIALGDLGISGLIDDWYGTSSGSINLVYFSAGHSWDALSVYYDHLTDGFIRPVTSGLRRVDMDYLVEVVMKELVPLEPELVATSGMNVKIVLTDVDNVAPHVVSVRDVAAEIHEYLKCGAWLPILAGPPPLLHGRRYLDGGVVYADPLYAALADDCTHILVINSAPQHAPEHPPAARYILRTILNQWQAHLGSTYFQSRMQWDRDRRQLGYGRTTNFSGIATLRIAPPAHSHKVERLTLDRGELLQGARAGYSAVVDQFTTPRPSFFSITTRGGLPG